MILVNEAQEHLQALINAVSDSHQPVVIEGHNINMVLVPEADWASV